jgi:hypothetical protein
MPRDARIRLHLEDGTAKELASKWEVCPCCSGDGKSSAHLGAITGDQMRDEPDFAEAYKTGEYDRRCDDCGGSGKVRAPDYRAMRPDDARAYRAQLAGDAEIDAIQCAESAAEAGWSPNY